ncbi:pyridoxamine 5'-phosphate oxidase family protein [Natronomonas sp. LN261]|jgi:nitroimidazol reductase NimA-like FMN-containing flavoprotein (pyridoxamine 5'-phosphate oxidase superfamily)|uniref:pyridoxamine 5'-phosphate oxidase family protein n=1 Tax=Natronomonas sp. LN261 TaxID=2750669 RepID=UPI0015EE83ED|nr:pyridoxamine 5'-phosphate oxidase family protein [Natronomonas sp. LN261]
MTVDELEAYGTERMDGAEIDRLLSNESMAVLALPTDGAPSMRPLSFHFDGESGLYFVYVLGEESRKAELSERADAARLLVYRMETAFNWRSVLLTGTISRVPEGEADELDEVIETRRPNLFERAIASEHTELYRFEIEDRSGIEHLGLPPGFEGDGETRK